MKTPDPMETEHYYQAAWAYATGAAAEWTDGEIRRAITHWFGLQASPHMATAAETAAMVDALSDTLLARGEAASVLI